MLCCVVMFDVVLHIIQMCCDYYEMLCYVMLRCVVRRFAMLCYIYTCIYKKHRHVYIHICGSVYVSVPVYVNVHAYVHTFRGPYIDK